MAGYSTKELQDDFLDTVRESQEMTVQAVRTYVALIQPMAPKAFFGPLSPSEMPKPEEISTGFYDVAQKLLDSQRHFTQEWLKAMAPLVRDGSDQ
jgi:hypothetical protein